MIGTIVNTLMAAVIVTVYVSVPTIEMSAKTFTSIFC